MSSGVRRLGFLLLLATAAVLAVSRSLGHRAVFPGARTGFPVAAALSVRAPRAGVLRFLSVDGARLAALHVPSSRENAAATVVYFHATNQSAADALLFAADLAARGVDVLVPEHRGYGGLPGRPSREGLFADAEAALDAAGVEPERTILVGRSLGGAVAAEMARRGRGRALVLLSPFTSVQEVAWPFGWAVAPDDRFDTRAALAATSVPVTIVHGKKDGVIPFWMGQALAGEQAAARFRALPDAGHNDLFLDGAREILLDEIERAAAGPAFSLRSEGAER